MRFPEGVILLFFKNLVVGIGGSGLFERRVPCVHDEEYDSGCEYVNAPALIFFGGDFRGHVAFSAQLRF